MKTPQLHPRKSLNTHKEGETLINAEESLHIKDHNFQRFSAAGTDTVQLAVFVCGVHMQFNTNDRLSSCQ
jgi:hypothetical protein